MRLGIWGIASVIFFALAPAAFGARYAAPAGTGSECTQAKPCFIIEAVGGAKAGDEVIIGAGTYPVGSPINYPAGTNIQVHGEAGGPPPKVTASFGSNVFNLSQTGDSLSYIEIEDNANGGAGITCFSSRIERVRVQVVGVAAAGVFANQDCAIRNSLFRLEGTESFGLRSGGSSGNTSASARNVTVIASGSGSTGAIAEYSGGSSGSFTLELQNSIVQGTGQDLKPVAGAKGPGNIVASHSNFDTSSPVGEAKVIDGGGNQTAQPLYVDAEKNDFREGAGSPTIDGGIAGELGPLDLAGNARILGAAPDIGAYEATPAPAPAAGQLQSLKASPNAFRAAKSGGAVTSAKKKQKGPVGTKVTYSLSAAGTIDFTIEQLTTGRKVGKKCVKQTAANTDKKKCDLAKKLKGGFSVTGGGGEGRFKFSGRLGNKALKPGRYKLVGSAGGVVKRASFKILE